MRRLLPWLPALLLMLVGVGASLWTSAELQRREAATAELEAQLQAERTANARLASDLETAAAARDAVSAQLVGALGIAEDQGRRIERARLRAEALEAIIRLALSGSQPTSQQSADMLALLERATRDDVALRARYERVVASGGRDVAALSALLTDLAASVPAALR